MEQFGSKKFDYDIVVRQVESKSGAREFKLCYMREEFLNCPPSRYKGGDDCDALSAKLLKCPNLPVFLGPKNISV